MGVITALFSAERVTGAATSTSHPNPASKTATPGWSHSIFGQFVTGLVGSLKFQGESPRHTQEPGRQGQELRCDTAAGGYSCHPRDLKLQVGPAHANLNSKSAVIHGQNSALPACNPCSRGRVQETPAPTSRLGQPHQLFQLGLRMDHCFYC